jgi:outer membrane receptor for ferrienterochelin and colicins
MINSKKPIYRKPAYRQSASTVAAFILLSQLAPKVMAQVVPVGADPNSGSAYNNKLDRVEIRAKPQSDEELRRRDSVVKQIYGRETIEKYSDNSLADVIRRLPGVDVQAGVPRLRGLGSGYSQILINGDPAPNGFSLDQLNPAQVERIEISKAPTADQSAQAVAGNINIILKAPPRKRQLDLKFGLGYSTQHPTPNASIVYGERVGDLSFSLPVSAFEWRGATALSAARQLPVVAGVQGHSLQSAKQPLWGYNLNASPQLNWHINGNESLRLQAFLQQRHWNSKVLFTNIETTSNTLLEDPSRNQGNFENQRLSAQWRRRLSDAQSLEIKLSVGNATDSFTNQTFRTGTPYRLSEGKSKDKTVIQSGKFSQLAGDNHSLSAGWEIETRRREDNRNVLVLGQQQLIGIDGVPFDVRINRQAFYVQDEWQLSKQLLIYGGLRHESLDTRSDGLSGVANNTSRVLTPLLHLNYKLTPDGKNLLRASLTRSYKAPDLYALVARPSLNSLYPDPNQSNIEIASDRAGNPALRPELATGLDVAFETYFGDAGIISVGVFYRRVNDLIRYVNTLENVSWATVPRWVSRPRNFSKANSSGLELSAKGQAGELFPVLFDPKLALSLHWALNVYHSKVDAVPLTNNRLDDQQPWSTNLGFDYKFQSIPLTLGSDLSYTPGYLSQQTLTQSLDQSRSRSLDFYGNWTLSKRASLRFAITNALPLDTRRVAASDSGARLDTVRESLANYSLGLEMKF